MKGERLSNFREANSTTEGSKEVEEVNYKELFFNEGYDAYFVEFTGDIQERLKNIDYAKMYYTDNFFGTIFVKQGMLNTLLQSVPEITILHKNFPYTLTPTVLEEGPFSPKGIEKGNVPYNGEGVVVGIISTGIDYLNPRFMKEDGTTRIISIWDQTIDMGKRHHSIIYGKEFTRLDINEAIKLNTLGQNPYDKVEHRDETGYGTAMAGIVGGRKLDQTEAFSSVAPNCEFAIVKLKKAKKNILVVNAIEESEAGVYEGIDIAEAMDYLSTLQQALNKPMVVYIPLGSNLGGHDGGTVLERYIDFLTERRGFATVATVGVQGTGDTHTSGNLFETGGQDTIDINIAEGENNIIISLYTIQPDKVSVGIIAPDGSTVEKIETPTNQGESITFNLSSSTITIQNYSEEKVVPDNNLEFLIRGLTPGVWKITLKAEQLLNGRYDAWMTQKNLLQKETRFLKPDPFITVVTPSTARNMISTGFYNQDTGELIEESGKGFTRDGRIKPDVITASYRIITTGLENKLIVGCGSGVAGAILAGTVALMFQWGIVDGNNPNLYAQSIRNYIIGATSKDEGVSYPNPESGYGKLNIPKIFENLKKIKFNIPNKNKIAACSKEASCEKTINYSSKEADTGVFVSIPKEILKRINYR
ncbi:S8 family peptidase [Clostridium sp. UBA4548]|uniref:S8 family peptidase n=1 Tax=Clostridium sp. UBA4548 TaxID=1946361 RepID=UPI0025B97B78|nr:S8 family peptidase [Clostridium sp. UBA4548]